MANGYHKAQVSGASAALDVAVSQLVSIAGKAADEEQRLSTMLNAAKEQAYITILKASTEEEVAEAHEAIVTILLTGSI